MGYSVLRFSSIYKNSDIVKVELNIVNTEFAMFQFEYVSMVLSVPKAFL